MGIPGVFHPRGLRTPGVPELALVKRISGNPATPGGSWTRGPIGPFREMSKLCGGTVDLGVSETIPGDRFRGQRLQMAVEGSQIY